MANRSDDFNRADDAVAIGSPSDGGGAYTVSGGWGISSNRAYKTATNSFWETAVLEASSSVVDVDAVISVIGRGGPVARWANDSNMLFIANEATQTLMYKRVGGTFTQLGSTYTNTAVAGDVWTLRVTSANAISALKNGVLRIGPVTDAAGSTNTKHGLAIYNTATRLDALVITDNAGGGGGPVGLASETDTALGLSGVHLRAAGLATEADTALALSARQIAAVGLAAETDTALARTATLIRPAGLATETDTALALAPGAAPGAVGLAIETDQALALQARQIRAVGLAVETDTALALSPGSGALVGMALEIDTAFALQAVQRRPVGLAVESDTALALLPLGATPADSLARFTISAQARRLSIAATARRLEIGR